MGQLDGVPEFFHKKERRISAEDKASPKPTPSSLPESMVSDLFAQTGLLVGKADALLSEVRRTAREFIPVHKEALETRLALRSLYPSASEERLSLGQYMDSLNYLDKQTNVDPIALGSALTGNDQVDVRLLSQEMDKSARAGTDWADAVVTSSQFLLLAVANRMLQTWQAPNTQQAVAAKMPPATEVGATLIQLAVGIGAILLQTLTSKEEVAAHLRESFGESMSAMGVTVEDVIAQAQAVPPDATMRAYQQSREAEHRASIRGYAQSYVAATTEPGYEPWISAAEVEDIKSDLTASLNEGTNYVKGPYVMGTEIYKMLACKNLDANDGLNKIAAVLSSNYTRDMVCCLVRFLGALPTDTLKKFRLMLNIAINGASVDLSAGINTALANANDYLERKTLEPILHLIDNFYAKISEQMRLLMDPSTYKDKDAFESLLACSPVEEMFTYVFSALSKLKSFIIKHIRQYWSRLEAKGLSRSYRINILADARRARMLLKILDAVIAAVDHGNLCAPKDELVPSPEDVSDFVDQAMAGMPTAISVETSGNPYSTFQTEDLKEFESAAGIKVLMSLDPDRRRGLGDCARARITEETVAAFATRAEEARKAENAG